MKLVSHATTSRRRSRFLISRSPALLALSLLSFTVPGCGVGGGEDVNARTMGQAKRLWDRAGVADYDLEWSSSGARDGHYRVRVRGGVVERVTQVLGDGSVREARPGDASYYGVDGLFRTIEADVDHCRELIERGPEKGSRVFLRFWPDPALGYPRRYRRDVSGSLRSLAIDVLRFDPKPNDAPSSGKSKTTNEER